MPAPEYRPALRGKRSPLLLCPAGLPGQAPVRPSEEPQPALAPAAGMN